MFSQFSQFSKLTSNGPNHSPINQIQPNLSSVHLTHQPSTHFQLHFSPYTITTNNSILDLFITMLKKHVAFDYHFSWPAYLDMLLSASTQTQINQINQISKVDFCLCFYYLTRKFVKRSKEVVKVISNPCVNCYCGAPRPQSRWSRRPWCRCRARAARLVGTTNFFFERRGIFKS